MKKIIALSSMVLLSFTSIGTQAYFKTTYSGEIKIHKTLTNSKKNSRTNINTAKKLEKIIKSFKSQVTKVKTSYSLKKDKKIKSYEKELNLMIGGLKKVQSVKVSKSDAKDVMGSVIQNLKGDLVPKVRSHIKKIVKEQKEALRKVAGQYNSLAKKISKNLEKNVVMKTIKYIKTNKNLSKKEKLDIIKPLAKIYKITNKFKKFDKQNFKNKKDIKVKFLADIKVLKSSIKDLKKVLKK